MKLSKFFGQTSRSVLEQVRNELGPDAVIVSNRTTANGIEVTAVAAEAFDSVVGDARVPAQEVHEAPPQRPAETHAQAITRLEPKAPTVASAATPPDTEPRRWEPPRSNARPVNAPVARSREEPPPVRVAAVPAATVEIAPLPVEVPVRIAADAPMPADATQRLMDEVHAMRDWIEGQFAQLAWSDSVRRQPLRAQFTRDLLASGYSASLARQITQRLPDDYSEAQAREWLVGVMARNLRCGDPTDDIVARGGVYALVGPTGVGKTTTTAKLAARCAVRYGARQLALLTTDSYRIGAQDQLRIYAKILGVAVHTVTDAAELRATLDSLAGKHLVLIDTVGMGQRDTRLAEHSHWLAQPEVKRLLLLNATAQGETLEEVVAAYGASGTRREDFAGSIITKIDEGARPGQVLDILIRHKLSLQYVSNGQRVPEDLHSPNASYLIDRSLRSSAKGAPATPFTLQDDEVAMVLAQAGVSAHA